MATQTTTPGAGGTPLPALEFENVLYEKDEGIAHVTFNRPAVLNALNGPTLAELRAALEDARDDDRVRGVILTGGGDKAFAPGADIVQLAKASAVEAERSSRSTQETFHLLENLGKP